MYSSRLLRATSLLPRRHLAQTLARRSASTEASKPQDQQSSQAAPSDAPGETATQPPVVDEKMKKFHLSKVVDSIREGTRFMANYDKEDFATANSIFAGTHSYAKANNVQDPFELGAIQVNRAYIFQANGKSDEALKLYESGLELLKPEQAYSKDPRFYGVRLMSYADLLVSLGRFDEAQKAYQQAVKILKDAFQSKSELIGIALSNLAATLSQQEKYNEALPFAEEALSVLKAVLGQRSELTKNCAVNLVLLYNALGTPEKIKGLDASFNDPDQPILKPLDKEFDTQKIEEMKAHWRKAGKRGMFDMPGLHKGHLLSAESTKAFLNAWSANRGSPEPFYSDLALSELAALEETHDKLKKWKPKQILGPDGKTTLDHNKPNFPREAFHDKPVRGVTSVAEHVQSWPKRIEALRNMQPDQYTLTREEEDAVVARAKEYYEKLAKEPTLEIVEEGEEAADEQEETVAQETIRLMQADPDDLTEEQKERMHHLQRLYETKMGQKDEDAKIASLEKKAKDSIRAIAGIDAVADESETAIAEIEAKEVEEDADEMDITNTEIYNEQMDEARKALNEQFMAKLRPHWGEKDFWDQYYRHRSS